MDCKQCMFNSRNTHPDLDAGCSINSEFWKSAKTASTDCPMFKTLPQYNPNDPCIRQAFDGRWHHFKHIHSGWNESTLGYASLPELLDNAALSISYCYQDTDGEFFTVASTAIPLSQNPNSQSLDRSNNQRDRDLAIDAHDRISDQWIRVTSSNINQIAFDAVSQTLFIRFNSKAVYAYFQVDYTIWLNLQSASSKGQFLNAYIRNRFGYLCLSQV